LDLRWASRSTPGRAQKRARRFALALARNRTARVFCQPEPSKNPRRILEVASLESLRPTDGSPYGRIQTAGCTPAALFCTLGKGILIRSFVTSRRFLLTLLAGLIVLGVAAVELARRVSPEVEWRIAVVAAKVRGDVPDLRWSALATWLRPGSAVYLAPVAENPNLNASIQNGLIQDQYARRGRDVFLKTCSSCHGSDARGNSGPSLIEAVSQKSDWNFLSTVKWGRAGTPMQPQSLDDVSIWEVHAYLRKLALGASAASAPGSAARAPVDIPGQRIIDADKTPDEWLTYAGNYGGHRHSRLVEVSKATVQDLRIAWVAQLRPADRELQVSPVVAGGVMYVTESGESVVAIDAASGRTLWSYRRQAPTGLSLCCGMPNRGVALLGRTVYFATIDAHLIALDADSGKPRWDVAVADFRGGYSMTSAPLALPDRVVVGVAGGEFGVRGFLAAYDPDGHLLWKLNTVPGPGEPGNDTWAGDSWKTGGAPTPTTGAYDAAQDLVIWGTGNPGPTYQGSVRKGDNLYSNSVVAVDAKRGTLKWYYQFTPHDEHDWDSNQQPVLADIRWNGAAHPVVLWANRNGFFYALDRTNGAFLFAKAYAKQTWNVGFDANGRPRTANAARPSAEGTVVWPAVMAATNWWPPSYDATRNLVFVPSSDAAGTYFRADAGPYERGARFEFGAATHYSPNHPTAASVKAIDAATGTTRWRAVLGADSDNFVWTVGGVLSTAGGVAFAGYRDYFYALDSDTGKELWNINLGARVRGSPIAYALSGRQYVAVAAGSSLFTFALPAR
jgi:alcohol dehydrogenase (cytochrome c)